MNTIDVISDINIFPFKGMRAATVDGEKPQTLSVGPTGFEAYGVVDRGMLVYDPAQDAAVTQRGWGNQGKKIINPGDGVLAAVEVDIRHDHMLLSSPIGTWEVENKPAGTEHRDIRIFENRLAVVGLDKATNRYFSKLLGREVEALQADQSDPRMLPEEYRREGAINQMAAADGMPFLLMNKASLAAAHEQTGMAPGTVPIDRYRANIVAEGEGLGPFGEDYIDTQEPFQAGEIDVWANKPCARCPVTDHNQQSGERVGGGLRVLRERAGRIFNGDRGVYMGQNLVHGNLGRISIGDKITVTHMSDTSSVELRAAVLAS